MSDNLYLTPEEAFPDELGRLADLELQVLDSQVQRQLDHEVIVAVNRTNPETEFRQFEVDEEFTNRGEH